MPPRVSIILINYHQDALTKSCIKMIQEQVKSVPYEIIVIDNSTNNVGFGTANNNGVKKAKGDFIFLLNNDTILKNDPLEYFVPYMESHPDVGAVGTLLKNIDGDYCLSGGNEYTIQKYLRIGLKPYWNIPHQPEVDFHKAEQETDYIIGADLFMRKEDFIALGGFDEQIFMYFEDVELCYRLRQNGKRCALITGPDIVHLEGGSGTTMFQKVHNTASLIYCLSKKYSRWQLLLFQIAYFLLKLPIILRDGTKEWQYVSAIWCYKKHLRH